MRILFATFFALFFAMSSIGVAEAQANAGYSTYGPPYTFYGNSELSTCESYFNQTIPPEATVNAEINDITSLFVTCGVVPYGCTTVQSRAVPAQPFDVIYNCRGAYQVVYINATAYPYDPGKALGDPGCQCAGDPINLGTGNEYRREVDWASGDLGIARFYNSHQAASVGSLGAHWRTNFDRSVSATLVGTGGTSVATVLRPDGRQLKFTQNASGPWIADSDVASRLTEQVDGSGKLTGWLYFNATNREQEAYNVQGQLISIREPNGQVTTLTWSGMWLQSVVDGLGRAITFNNEWFYPLNSAASYVLITSATLPDGGTISFTYDTAGNLTKVTYPDGSYKQYLYNESAFTGGANLPYALTGVVDESGSRVTSISYNANGLATSSMSASGINETQLTFNGNGTTTATYPLGAQATLNFSTPIGTIHTSSVDQPCGPGCHQANRTATYDSNGYLATATDFNGVTTNTTYDANGLLDQKVEAVGTTAQRTTNTTWDATLRVPTSMVVLSSGGSPVAQTSWVYNVLGQPLAVCEIDPNVPAAAAYTCSASGSTPAGVRRWTYTYCTTVDTIQCPLIGLMLTAIGPRTDVAQTTSYSYYMTGSATSCGTPGAACHQPGDLYQVIDAMGHVTTYASYDADGRVTRTIDANGINSDLTYTPRGWLSSQSVGGASTSFTYTSYGAIASVTDPDGITTTYGYDQAHRLIRITDALGNYEQYALDAAGNRTSDQIYDQAGVVHKTLARTFNSLGQLATFVDGLNHTVFSATNAGSYDGNGNLVLSQDALSIQRKLGYDALNRLVSTIADYNGTDSLTPNTATAQSYDSLDRLTQIVDPSSLATTYQYDGLSNAVGINSPDTGVASRTFDAAGNSITGTDAKGIVVTNTYDAIDRKLSASYVDSTQNVGYAYDEPNSATGCVSSYPAGRLTRIIESTVTTTYCYDARGNVLAKSQTIGSLSSTIFYTYTAANRLSSMTYPSGTAVAYAFDADGRIQAINVTPAGGSSTAVASAISYLPFGPLAGYTLGNGQAVVRSYDGNYQFTDVVSPSFALHLARDAMGNVIATGNSAGASPATETYTYDPLYRLTTITEADGTTLESMTYNGTGDRTSKSGSGLATGAYTYAPGTHQLTAVGNAVRMLDADGNTTAISQAGAMYGLRYSSRGTLTVAQAAGSTVGTYIYNALSQRVSKTTSGAEQFWYDEASHLLTESGQTNRDYVWLADLPVALVDITVNSGTKTSMLAYITADGMSSPRTVTNGAGTVVWQWAYQGNPFGEQMPTSTSGYVLNLRYPGQYYDVESGLQYNFYRYYEPATGRYIQSDSMGLNGGLGTYTYVNGNPLYYSDPRGQCPWCVGAVIGAITGGIAGYETGGWEGAAIGGAIGAGVGAAAPFAATSVGALVTEATGSILAGQAATVATFSSVNAAGAAAGTAITNAVEDQPVTKDLGIATAIGATAAVPEAIGVATGGADASLLAGGALSAVTGLNNIAITATTIPVQPGQLPVVPTITPLGCK